MIRRPPRSTRTDTLFPYPTSFRSSPLQDPGGDGRPELPARLPVVGAGTVEHSHVLGRLHPPEPGSDLGDVLQRPVDVAVAVHVRPERPPPGLLEAGVVDGVEAVLARARPRSEARRAGNEIVSTCRSRWSPYHYKKNNSTYNHYT